MGCSWCHAATRTRPLMKTSNGSNLQLDGGRYQTRFIIMDADDNSGHQQSLSNHLWKKRCLRNGLRHIEKRKQGSAISKKIQGAAEDKEASGLRHRLFTWYFMPLVSYIAHLPILVHCNKGNVIFMDGLIGLHVVRRISSWSSFEFGTIFNFLYFDCTEGSFNIS